MKTLLLAALVLALNGPAIVAQTAPAPAAPAATAEKNAPNETAVRKLSRRERTDRIARLSDRYRQFLEEVEPILQPNELDAFLTLETDPQREIFINEFWRRRDVAQGTSNRAFRDQYMSRLEFARETFKQLSSDRSRMYLLYGEPMSRTAYDCSKLLQPLEIWTYHEIPKMGHTVRFVFFVPRNGRDYKLWVPGMDTDRSLAELVSLDGAAAANTDEQAVDKVFRSSGSLSSVRSKVEMQCTHGDEIMIAISSAMQARTDLLTVFEAPQVDPEGAARILRSVVLATPNAPKLPAELKVRYPAKQGSRTDAELTVLVPRAELKTKEVGGKSMYSLDVTGEVLRNGELYENYRYRFDFPGDATDEKLPLIVDRFLRPNEYVARIKVSDVNSGAEAIIESALTVPEIFDTPEQKARKAEGAAAVAQLVQDAAGEARLRIVPPAEEMLSGIQKIETIATGDAIKAVEFWLDGKKIAVKRTPPFTLDLDFGNVPHVRRVRAVALDEKGETLTGDDLTLNTGNEPFRVRIVSPRVANNLHGRTRVEVAVKVPDGKELGDVELYWNETRIATIFDAPFVQTITIPEANGGVGYIRAVAKLKGDDTLPAEDVVMINTPAFMEEVNVHLVELPTTVLVGGRPANDLQQSAFAVLDEGEPVKVAKFEYVKNLPLSLGMAFDTSGSMQERMFEAQKAGATFLQSVLRKGDRAFLVAFDRMPQLVQKWSPSISDMHAGLAKLRAEDATSLYDAIVFSLYNFASVKGQKALIVISDGKDTASKFSHDQAIEYARRAAVPIYGIGIGIKSTEIDTRSKFARFATETGGNTYYIERASDLARIYKEIESELRAQYVIGFYPPAGAKPGKWREVTVQVKSGKAKTIKGYFP